MKLDFLKTLKEQEPCGLRAVIDPMSDTHPVMAFSDWKELANDLIDGGFVSRKGNGQYQVTPAGEEAIDKGASFLEEDEENEEPDDDEVELKTKATVKPEKAHHKPAPGHPWKAPLVTRKQISGESPMDPAGLRNNKPKVKERPAAEPEKQAPKASLEHELDIVADSLSESIERPIKGMSTDELLNECHLSKKLMTSLNTRRELAMDEISRRLGKGFFLEVRYRAESNEERRHDA